jgi:hypothetical protein
MLVSCVLLGAALLAYLRDPPWLVRVTSGFEGLEHDRGGRAFRWISGRASFFVPAGTERVRIPLRALFLTGDRRPFVVSVQVNDRRASVMSLDDERWREAEVSIAPDAAGGRRAVRLDLHVSRTWSERSLGVEVGEITVLPGGAK